MSEKRSSADTSPPFSVTIYMQDLSGGGVERQTLTLAGELQAKGMAVSLLVHQARGELSDRVPAGVRLTELGTRRTWRAVPRIASYLRRERPDILLSNLDHNNVAAALGNMLAGVQTKLVICQHNAISAAYLHTKGWSHRLIPQAYRLVSPGYQRAVAVSAGIARELHAVAHIPESKIVIIPNPVIGPDFDARLQQTAAHPWKDVSETPLFVTAGRLVPVKDHETLLRAFSIFRQQSGGRLLILGAGPLRGSLGTLADELGLGETVDFVGYQENPLPYIRRADAFVLSSYSEGFGNVLVEALGCGTPVISTNCEHGPAEILDGGRYGRLVPPRNAQALADAMSDVRELRGIWPATLLQSRASEFTTTACATAYFRIFQSVMRL